MYSKCPKKKKKKNRKKQLFPIASTKRHFGSHSSFARSLSRLLILWFVRLFICSFANSFLYSFLPSFIRSSVCSFFYCLILSFVGPFVRSPFLLQFVRSFGFFRPLVRPSVPASLFSGSFVRSFVRPSVRPPVRLVGQTKHDMILSPVEKSASLTFDVYLTPWPSFPLWTQPKITPGNALWSAFAITSAITPITLDCASFKTITARFGAL